MKSKKSEKIIGLDIGSSSVKYVQISHTDSTVELLRAGVLPVAGEADIERALEKLSLGSAGHVRVSLSGPSVITRFLSMPALSVKELQSAVRFEAETHIPFPIDDCSLDYQVLKRDVSSKQISILLAAVKREFVERRYKLLSDSGIFPELIDLDVFCLVNAFEVLNSEEDKNIYGLLNIGHSLSSLAIVQDGLPVFAREISLGGLQVTRAISEMKNISEARAEEFKINKFDTETEILKAAAQKGFELLGEEIRHSIEYFENQTKLDLKNIFLSGGGALTVGVCEILAEEIGRPVVRWDNTKKIRMSSTIESAWINENSTRLNVALGMTVRDLGAKK